MFSTDALKGNMLYPDWCRAHRHKWPTTPPPGREGAWTLPYPGTVLLHNSLGNSVRIHLLQFFKAKSWWDGMEMDVILGGKKVDFFFFNLQERQEKKILFVCIHFPWNANLLSFTFLIVHKMSQGKSGACKREIVKKLLGNLQEQS